MHLLYSVLCAPIYIGALSSGYTKGACQCPVGFTQAPCAFFRVCKIVLILFVHFQAELFELAGFEYGGCVEHDIAAGIVLRERDAVADRIEAGEE